MMKISVWGGSGLQVLRAAAPGCLYQNPSGGRTCGEKRRREETVGNCGDDMKSMKQQSGRSEEGKS